MADLKEESRWEAGIRQFETSDPVQGGPDGVDNIALKQLGNRTRFLKDQADAADKRIQDISERAEASDKSIAGKLNRSGDTMGGALLGKPGAIAERNPKSVGFAFDGDPGTGMFSPVAGHLQMCAGGLPYVVLLGRNLTLGSTGSVSLVAGGKERALLTSKGRLLLGTADDNGRALVQVGGSLSASSEVISEGAGESGVHFRGVSRDYGMLLRNDNGRASFMSTAKGDPYGACNELRPVAWDLETGRLHLDETGAGAKIGGPVELASDLTVRLASGEGRVRVGQNDGYFHADESAAGWSSAQHGAFQYVFATRTLRVNDQMVYHAGNLDPLDLTEGGELKGTLRLAAGAQVVLPEGSAASPSIVFDQGDASCTGFYQIAGGGIGIACNGATAARISADKGTVFDCPVQAPTPAAGDRSNSVATTAFVIDAIGSASIGQIIFEIRTSPRAGCLVLNGTLLNRADYPALWAYAKGSGALVSDSDWINGNWGSFSTGDGANTFRIPEFRGEGIRCVDLGRGADAGRGIGTWQDSQNRSHTHLASADEVADHVHTAWTDAQGSHEHGVNDPGHLHGTHIGRVGVVAVDYGGGAGPYNWDRGDDYWSTTSATGISIGAAGVHGHIVGIGGSGRHAHVVTIAADGGSEARMRNIAVLPMIRAF